MLLLSGDPIGPPGAFGPLLSELRAFADARGLKLGAVGASERLRPRYEQLGLRTLYLGDEAIIELERFSLEGRPIRKVRQSVNRLAKAGYEAELHEVRELDTATIAQIERVIERGRQGAPERGFSMTMDSLAGRHADETLVVLARDADGEIRGALHFVPCYGRAAVSLSFMRRDPDTPNGLTEFMVARRWSSCATAACASCRSTSRRSRSGCTARCAGTSACWEARRAGQSVLPDREPVSLQRQVLPPLGAALPRLRGRARAAAREPRRRSGPRVSCESPVCASGGTPIGAR